MLICFGAVAGLKRVMDESPQQMSADVKQCLASLINSRQNVRKLTFDPNVSTEDDKIVSSSESEDEPSEQKYDFSQEVW